MGEKWLQKLAMLLESDHFITLNAAASTRFCLYEQARQNYEKK
jgi:hypothetical protein